MNIPEEDGDGDDVLHDTEAWERAYADDRSWESIVEDESGLLKSIDTVKQQRAHRRRLQAVGPHVQRGIIRYLYVIVDFSRAAAEMDFRPSRMAVIVNCVEAFVREFFDQNPLSHLGIITIKNGLAYQLTELSGSPEAHIQELRKNMEASGDASIQNALDLAYNSLSQIPSYGHRELVLLFSALSTCDPGNVMETIDKCKEAKIRCSVVGVAAEIYICKLLCEKSGGIYSVALNENHLKELILEHVLPPPASAEAALVSLVQMGFPQQAAEGSVAICACHGEVKIGGGYTCPRCRGRVCELPTECHICGLTLVSSPHLARSYHHLFPVPTFNEVNMDSALKGKQALEKFCFGCEAQLPFPGSKVVGVRLACQRCKRHYCYDCDLYIHESLHNCPGCEILSDSSNSLVT